MNKVLVLRCCNPDMTSYGGFVWPESGPVSCPDWSPEPVCGAGLHGWSWGFGELSASDIWDDPDSVWLVVSVEESEIVDLIGKVKFPRGNVVFRGTREDAGGYIVRNGGRGMPVMFAAVSAGDYGTATAGHRGTATAGNRGTAAAGDYGTATTGHRGTATAGDYGTATTGHRGTATAGNGGTATTRDYGTATAGDGGTATAGHYGTATAGAYGTAAAGAYGTATAGDYGTAAAGDGGVIQIRRFDGRRYRIVSVYVGENGIEPGVPYCLDGHGNFIKA